MPNQRGPQRRRQERRENKRVERELLTDANALRTARERAMVETAPMASMPTDQWSATCGGFQAMTDLHTAIEDLRAALIDEDAGNGHVRDCAFEVVDAHARATAAPGSKRRATRRMCDGRAGSSPGAGVSLRRRGADEVEPAVHA